MTREKIEQEFECAKVVAEAKMDAAILPASREYHSQAALLRKAFDEVFYAAQMVYLRELRAAEAAYHKAMEEYLR